MLIRASPTTAQNENGLGLQCFGTGETQYDCFNRGVTIYKDPFYLILYNFHVLGGFLMDLWYVQYIIAC